MAKEMEKISSTTRVILDYLSPEQAAIFCARLHQTLPENQGEVREHFNKVHEELGREREHFAKRRDETWSS